MARNIAGYLADEAVGRVGLNQAIFRKIEQDNCFIIPQIVIKTLFAARKIVVVHALQDFRRVLLTYVYRLLYYTESRFSEISKSRNYGWYTVLTQTSFISI